MPFAVVDENDRLSKRICAEHYHSPTNRADNFQPANALTEEILVNTQNVVITVLDPNPPLLVWDPENPGKK